VTTIALDADRLRELDAGEHEAWKTYRDSLRDLSGDEYERVEAESWDQLQRELRRLARRRKTLISKSA
jgi:broad specificity phosphatase PhoE